MTIEVADNKYSIIPLSLDYKNMNIKYILVWNN